MSIWKTRPLSFLILLSLGGFSLFAVQQTWVRITLMLCIAAGLVCLLLYLLFRRRNLSIAIAAIAVYAISLCLSFLYFDVWFFPERRFESESVKITATVTRANDNEYYTYLTVKTTSVQGAPLSRYRILLTSESGVGAELEVGDVIDATVHFTPYHEKYQTAEEQTYAMASGQNAVGELIEYTLLSHKQRPVMRVIAHIRQHLSELVYEKCDTDSGALFLALFAADRTYLSPALSRNFRRIGISHLLVLSGMHLSILALLIHRLLSLLGIERRTRIGILLVFVLFYMGITGFPISVVRAGVMLIIGSVYYLFALPHDSVTTLAIAVFLIVLIEPYALLDVSLLLSALATLGILEGGELLRAKQEKKGWRALLYPVLVSVVLTLFAMAYTTVITVLSFEEVSLLSVPATLIFSVLIEMYIYLGLLVVALPFIPFLPYILSYFYGIIDKFSSLLSDIPYASVSVDFRAVTILAILFGVCLLLCLLLEGRAAHVAKIVTLLLFVSVYATALTLHVSTLYTDDVIYYGAQQSEFILEKSQGDTLLLDFSSYGESYARRTLKAMQKEKITRLDGYAVFSYGYLLTDTLNLLLSNFPIETLYLPIPVEESEEDIYRQVVECVTRYRTKIVTYQRDSVIQNGEMKNTILSITARSKGQRPILTITHKEHLYFYAASGAITYSTNSKTVAQARENCRVAIYGYRGRAYENPLYISYLPPATKMIIAAGNNINIKWTVAEELNPKNALLYAAWRLSLLNVE